MNNFLFGPPKFLDPQRILFAAGLSAGQSLVDLGAGSGFYVIAASKIVGEQGSVYAVDILDAALEHVAAEARLKGLRNVQTVKADLEETNSCEQIGSGLVDYVLFANIIHQVKNRKDLFAESYRLLKTGGKLIVIEWDNTPTQIGPAASERVAPDVITALAKQTTFKSLGTLQTDNYHYGLMFIK